MVIAIGEASGASPNLKYVPPHFMFEPRLLSASNIVFIKCGPTCGIWHPLLRNPSDGHEADE